MTEKIVVGMSGGVDSFATALLLQEKGYEVTGVNLELWEKNDTTAVAGICRQLGIPLLYREARQLFREKVVQPFVRGYLSGQTPSPCCLCNGNIKWHLLAGVARELGIAKIATGHYVRIVEQGGRYYIARGCDPVKDQSYFLWEVPEDILSRSVTPLGEYTKAAVKAWALERGYAEIVRKRESMGICFLQGCNYREFVGRYTAERLPGPGRIVDRQGRVIGEHTGIFQYTVGQKQGMPLWQGRPLYVAAIDAARNEIVADVKEGLYADTLVVEGIQAIRPEDLTAGGVEIRIRGLGLNPRGEVSLEPLEDGKWKVRLAEPAWAVAPGQPVAFYREDLLLGGGIATAAGEKMQISG